MTGGPSRATWGEPLFSPTASDSGLRANPRAPRSGPPDPIASIEHAVPIRDQNRLEARLDAEFAQDSANVVANSLDRQAGTLRHLPRRQAGAEHPQHFPLTRRQPRRGLGAATARRNWAR